MLPEGILDIEINETQQTSNTYKLGSEKIQGTVDELKAVEQAIYKILDTEKYNYPIYSFDYGLGIERLIGQDADYAKIEFKRLIKEALMYDDRIQDVLNFSFKSEGDELICEFDVITIYGTITAAKEVTI